jgi:hypothetical protein
LFARFCSASDGLVSFGEMQAKERIRLAELQASFHFSDGPLRVAADYFGSFQINQTQNHVGASVLITFVDL